MFKEQLVGHPVKEIEYIHTYKYIHVCISIHYPGSIVN